MEHFVIQFLLFFLSCVIWPFGASQFEIPKVITAITGIVLLSLSVFFRKRFQQLDRRLLVLLAGIFVLSFSHLLMLHTSISFFGNHFRGQGILLLWSLLIFGIISSQVIYTRMKWYWYGLCFFVLFISSLFLGTAQGRSVGTLGEPNALAGSIDFLWPFLFFAEDLPKKYERIIHVFTIAVVLVIIFLSGSRSGLLAFMLQCIFLISWRMKKNLRLSILLGLVFLGAIHVLPFFEHTVYENRGVIWQTAFSAGFLHPFLGGGFGNTETLLRTVIVREHNTLIGYSIDSSHNLFLDWWVQGGVVGLGMLVTLISSAFIRLYERHDRFLLLLLLGLLVVLSLNPVSVVTLVQLWWLIGYSYSNFPARSGKIDGYEKSREDH